MSLGQRSVCVPIASGWSCVSREIYKGEQRKIPRYSRVSYHQKGTRTHLILKMTHRFFGFDHGVGHRLLLLCHAKAPNYGKKKAFKDLAYYSEWPKVAD